MKKSINNAIKRVLQSRVFCPEECSTKNGFLSKSMDNQTKNNNKKALQRRAKNRANGGVGWDVNLMWYKVFQWIRNFKLKLSLLRGAVLYLIRGITRYKGKSSSTFLIVPDARNSSTVIPASLASLSIFSSSSASMVMLTSFLLVVICMSIL